MAFPHTLISPISLYLIFLTLYSKTHLSFSARIPILNLSLLSNPIRPIADVHDLLAQYGLPKGLLPNNVKSYTLSDDGAFQIVLERSCYVQFDELVYYDKVIKGKLKYGSVSDVNGIQAKKLFLWVTVTGMDADFDAGMIKFHVGALSEKLPAKQFENVPSCKNKACQETNPQSF